MAATSFLLHTPLLVEYIINSDTCRKLQNIRNDPYEVMLTVNYCVVKENIIVHPKKKIMKKLYV